MARGSSKAKQGKKEQEQEEAGRRHEADVSGAEHGPEDKGTVNVSKGLKQKKQQEQQEQGQASKGKAKGKKKNKKKKDNKKKNQQQEQDPDEEQGQAMAAKEIDCTVYLLRHAERTENMEENEAWTSSGRVYDPPITKRGTQQALSAAKHLKEVHAQTPFKCVFSSPLVRCVQTAALVARQLNIPVRIVRGLASCTRALRTKDITTVPVGSLEELRETCAKTLPLSTVAEGGKQQQPEALVPRMEHVEASDAATVLEAVLDCLTMSMGDDNVLICGHREAVRDLLQDSGEALPKASRKQIAFCSVASFSFNEASCSFEFEGIANTFLPQETKEEKRKKKRQKRKNSKQRKRELWEQREAKRAAKRAAKEREEQRQQGGEDKGRKKEEGDRGREKKVQVRKDADDDAFAVGADEDGRHADENASKRAKTSKKARRGTGKDDSKLGNEGEEDDGEGREDMDEEVDEDDPEMWEAIDPASLGVNM